MEVENGSMKETGLGGTLSPLSSLWEEDCLDLLFWHGILFQGLLYDAVCGFGGIYLHCR